MIEHKIIQFYRRSIYGNNFEYIKNPIDAAIITQLTGQKTIDVRIRELLRELTDDFIQFKEVIAP